MEASPLVPPPGGTRLTYLGHAGFLFETSRAVVVADPWLSPGGAFDAAWFQFPRNHHLAAVVDDALADRRRARYIYISHEHKDHFDPAFLRGLRDRDFSFVVGRFRRDALRKALEPIGLPVHALGDGESLQVPGGRLRIFLDDSELNRDSALLIELDGTRFLDLNDCKLHDALPNLLGGQRLDGLAMQFSGATWHPTCYDYAPEEYAAISRRKQRTKFEAVRRALDALRPRLLMPSAGPACFLDPELFHLNLEPVNIFPRAESLHEYLGDHLDRTGTRWAEPMPGDVYALPAGERVHTASVRVGPQEHESYLRDYAAQYQLLFQNRRRAVDPGAVLERLRLALQAKLDRFPLRERVRVPLWFSLTDVPTRALRLDFAAGAVTESTPPAAPPFYHVRANSWDVGRVLDGHLTWEDFALTFRVRLRRDPDVYQTLLQGFLILEEVDLVHFAQRVLGQEAKRERTVVEAEGHRYAVDRWCPHQGADLRTAWVEDSCVVCPRHGWRFDLRAGGQCAANGASIHSERVTDE